MNIEEAAPVIDAGQPATATPEPQEPGELSIADHEAEYPALSRADKEAEARKARASAQSTPKLGTDGAPLSDGSADPDARDDKGRFRHRAKSQQAGAADVPRINELTAKLRAAEARADAAEKRVSPTPASVPPTAATPPPAPVRVDAFTQPAPLFKDFLAKLAANETYDDAVQRHAEAVADWRWQKASHEQAQQAKQKEFYGGFEAKTKEAAKQYPDFQTVALDADSVIPVGSFIDSWVWEHPTGAHVLYHMQKHPADVARIHALPPFEQLSELSLLGQRLTTPPSRTVAAVTGSAPAPVVVTPAPRPPNPVRTGPVKAADAPLGEDATIADHESRFGSKRHR